MIKSNTEFCWVLYKEQDFHDPEIIGIYRLRERAERALASAQARVKAAPCGSWASKYTFCIEEFPLDQEVPPL